MSIGTIHMAKRKAVPSKPSPPTATPVADHPEADRTVIVHLKGTPEYAAWIDDLNKRTHIPKAALFRLAMSAYAKAQGYPLPPER
jgi:hypothetical protein